MFNVKEEVDSLNTCERATLCSDWRNKSVFIHSNSKPQMWVV